MLVQEMKIWDEDNHATMRTYILDDSKEFQQGKKRPAIIVCPGGAYLWTSDREAEQVALRFASHGFHAFVLRYNTYFTGFPTNFDQSMSVNEASLYPNALFDLAKAITILRENAEEWHIDENKIGTCGFSAGGNLVGNMSVHWQDDFLKERLGVDSELMKPNATIMGYPVLDYILMREMALKDTDSIMAQAISQKANVATFGTAIPSDEQLIQMSPIFHISEKTTPSFIWHTANDELVYVQNSLKYALELSKNKIPFELHVFEDGVHGLSLSDETTAKEQIHINEPCQIWFEMAINWLKKYF